MRIGDRRDFSRACYLSSFRNAVDIGQASISRPNTEGEATKEFSLFNTIERKRERETNQRLPDGTSARVR